MSLSDADLVKACAEARGWKDGDRELGAPTYYVYPTGIFRHNANGTRTEWNPLTNEWNPLTNEADCWGLVDSLDGGETIEVGRSASGLWAVSIAGDPYVYDASRCRAITLAYLRAKGVEID